MHKYLPIYGKCRLLYSILLGVIVMNFIFIINNIELGCTLYSTNEIIEYLLGQNVWAFSENAPNLRYFSEGDKAIIYLAGKDNRFFVADFIISDKPYGATRNIHEPEWLVMFPIRIKIQNINKWTETLPISEIINNLDFIQDKKNYGLYFRQSTKVISEKDYYTIVQSRS